MRRYRADALAVLLLTLLWLLFFWRVFTPMLEDQASLIASDFSGQFVTFGGYQYERLSNGEVPLWNPYNNGGLPFIADTQAAALYPPRLLTVALSSEWTYNALQLEMTAHVLVYTLLMYLFVRRLLLDRGAGQINIVAAFTAAIVAGYGGFLTGYPQLQIALLEAATWLPLALLGVLEATRYPRFYHYMLPRPAWLALGGFGLGLSWLAGHPQTSWFATYLVSAYLAYRVMRQRYRLIAFPLGLALLGAITIGVTAVHLLPGLEYLSRTMRTGLGFDAKAGGFPPHDLVQVIFPNVMSFWSPLFIGVSGLALAAAGLLSRERERLFWGAVAVIALGLSFGENSALFHALYNLLPGLSFFRGQERAAFLIANALAILAGFGVVALWRDTRIYRRLIQGVVGLVIICLLVAGGILLLWLGDLETYDRFIGPVFFSLLMSLALFVVIWKLKYEPRRRLWLLALVALIVFELFSVNMDNNNYESIPASQRIIMTEPPLVTQVKADASVPPQRVDGGLVNDRIGIYGNGNTGSLYAVPDIRGISPLFLDGPHAIIQRELPTEIAWDLFAVHYVFSDFESLPVVDAEVVGQDFPDGQRLNLHRLVDPRPFALLAYDYVTVPDDQAARRLLADPAFDPRSTVILHGEPNITLPQDTPDAASATVTQYAPERFTIEAATSQNALLSLAHVDYPGWRVTIDGEPAERLRAYGGLSAVALPAGEHTVTFTYDPASYRIGLVLSLVTWSGLGILALFVIGIRLRRR